MQPKFNYDTNVKEADKFFEWLKHKYPVDKPIITEYPYRGFLEKKDLTGQLLTNGISYKIVIAAARPLSRVLQVVPHEYKHVLQIEKEGVPVNKIGTAQEVAAWKFSSEAMIEYLKQGDRNG